MASKLTVNFQDVNGQNSNTKFFTDAGDAVTALQALANLSNAQIVSAFLTDPLDLTDVDANIPVAANVETVKEKIKVRLEAPAGVDGAPFQYAIAAIPAPVGTMINATGEAQDPDGLATALVGLVQTNTGLVTTAINHIYYSRSR